MHSDDGDIVFCARSKTTYLMSDRCPLGAVDCYTTVVAVAQDVCGDVLNLFPLQSYADICLSQPLHVLNIFKT